MPSCFVISLAAATGASWRAVSCQRCGLASFCFCRSSASLLLPVFFTGLERGPHWSIGLVICPRTVSYQCCEWHYTPCTPPPPLHYPLHPLRPLHCLCPHTPHLIAHAHCHYCPAIIAQVLEMVVDLCWYEVCGTLGKRISKSLNGPILKRSSVWLHWLHWARGAGATMGIQ
jgi:hypothetical protein